METVTVEIPEAYKGRFERAAKFRNMSVASWIWELCEANSTDFVKDNTEEHPISFGPITQQESARVMRGKQLSPVQVQKILHLSTTLGVSELAKRFGCAPQTVRRVVNNYAATEHNSTAGNRVYKPKSSSSSKALHCWNGRP